MAEPELGSRFQRRFLAARQLRSFPWLELEQNLRTAPDSSLLVDILHKTILHPLCVKYPPSTKYRRCFLTELIKKHESTAAEPLDELYDTLADILNEEESTRCYKNYLLPTGECVTLSENVAIISGGTTGLVTWDAALHLAEWAIENSAVFSNSREEQALLRKDPAKLILNIDLTRKGTVLLKGLFLSTDYEKSWTTSLDGDNHAAEVQNQVGMYLIPVVEVLCTIRRSSYFKTVLELGSGIGFTGIAICKTCDPKTYIFSDCHPCVLKQLTENIRLNGFVLEPERTQHIQTESQGQEAEATNYQKPKLIVAELDWGSVTEKQLLDLQPDVVIAADVVYDPEIILALIGMLQKLSTFRADRKPPEVYIAFTIRNPDTYRLFQAELDKAGIRWQIIPARSNSIFLYDVQPNVTILQLFI